jgi:hypothetical protein
MGVGGEWGRVVMVVEMAVVMVVMVVKATWVMVAVMARCVGGCGHRSRPMKKGEGVIESTAKRGQLSSVSSSRPVLVAPSF